MKKVIINIFIIAFFFLSMCGVANASSDEALIIVDEPYTPGISPPSQATLENLLGHFDLSYDIKTIAEYTRGDVDRYGVTFYLGTAFDKTLPADFLEDVLASNSRIVWINYNIWKLGWDYQTQFESRFDFRFVEELSTGNFTKAAYAGKTFDRSQDNFGQATILNSTRAQTLATITNGTKSHPYIIRSGNFYYVADDPLSQQSESSPYLVFCDLLHDMVGIQHATDHRALVRIEDIDPTEDPASIRAIADYLYSENVPFSLAVIPRFTDPFGSWGPPITIDLNDSPGVVSALDYAVSKGGTIVMHGYTHQYGTVVNPTNGVSGVDTEFYIQQADANGDVVDVGPVPEDSVSWVQNRIDSGVDILSQAGFPRPTIWVTPHYLASDLDHQVFAANFDASYERFTNTWFPYVINKSVYGGRVIPENLGYLSFGVLTPQLLINRSDRNLAIRDGFASFFFHSEENISTLKTTVAGIKGKGYTFVDVNSLITVAPADTVSPTIGARWPVGTVVDTAIVAVRYSDPQPGSGINADSVSVTLDGVPLAGCTISDELAVCPVSGLAPGTHAIGGQVADNAGNPTPLSLSFQIADSRAPNIGARWPVGTVADTAIIAVRYSDPQPGSGINTASVSVTLDGVPLAGCTIAADLAICPVSGLAAGAHTIGGLIADNAGNSTPLSLSFQIADTRAPSIVAHWPSGTLRGDSNTVFIRYSDYPPASGINTGSVNVTMDGVPMTGCTFTAELASCPYSGLGSGTHSVGGSIADNAGNTTPVSFEFIITP